MNQHVSAATDVPQLIQDLEASLFERRLSVAISQVAASVIDRDKPGKIVIELNLAAIKGTHQVTCSHTIKYVRPTEAGKQSEEHTRETVLHVGKYGALSLAQPDLIGDASKQTSLA